MMEKYLVIYLDGDMRWIHCDHENFLQCCYDSIGCSSVERVRTVIRGIYMMVDECGKLKSPPQPHNHLASNLYAGWLRGRRDDICGPVVICGEGLIDGEPDCVPLSKIHLDILLRYLDDFYK